MLKVLQLSRMQCLVNNNNFKINSLLNRESVQLFKNWDNVTHALKYL